MALRCSKMVELSESHLLLRPQETSPISVSALPLTIRFCSPDRILILKVLIGSKTNTKIKILSISRISLCICFTMMMSRILIIKTKNLTCLLQPMANKEKRTSSSTTWRPRARNPTSNMYLKWKNKNKN